MIGLIPECVLPSAWTYASQPASCPLQPHHTLPFTIQCKPLAQRCAGLRLGCSIATVIGKYTPEHLSLWHPARGPFFILGTARPSHASQLFTWQTHTHTHTPVCSSSRLAVLCPVPLLLEPLLQLLHLLLHQQQLHTPLVQLALQQDDVNTAAAAAAEVGRAPGSLLRAAKEGNRGAAAVMRATLHFFFFFFPVAVCQPDDRRVHLPGCDVRNCPQSCILMPYHAQVQPSSDTCPLSPYQLLP